VDEAFLSSIDSCCSRAIRFIAQPPQKPWEKRAPPVALPPRQSHCRAHRDA
jgi:hypothetical protein